MKYLTKVFDRVKDPKYVEIRSVNPLYLTISKVNGILEKVMEINI